jgi:phosphohistidine phosphatase
MTLRLILIRHAKSDWSTPGAADHERPLNARGRRQAPLIGKWLASRHDLPGQVLCSDAVRTAETLSLILPELPEQPAVAMLPQLYHAQPDTMLGLLHQQIAPVIMMVGHNPGISAFAAWLAHTPPHHPRFADFPTGATAVIDWGMDQWSQVTEASGAVRDFVIPDDLDA